jgi:hypothetical protein
VPHDRGRENRRGAGGGAYLAGDNAALAALYDRFAGGLFDTARAMLGTPQGSLPQTGGSTVAVAGVALAATTAGPFLCLTTGRRNSFRA